MEPVITPGGYEITKPIDIIMLTCNRLQITRVTVDELYKRIKTPFNLIVVDDNSIDGTQEYLYEQKNFDRISALEVLDNSNICQGYNKGFEHVESDYFITMQDDITPPDLEPCVVQQLIDLYIKHPGHAGIGCRIQRIPNMNWQEGDLTPARKSLSAYFRVQHRKDFEGHNKPFGDRDWDDQHFVAEMRGKRGLECSWANNLWADHSRGYCLDRGYLVKPRKWGIGIHSRTRQAHIEKPYPIIDPKTCVPLHILNADKVIGKRVYPDADFYGFKLRTRFNYYDRKIINDEVGGEIYHIPKDAKVVIDIGAHIGGTALLAARNGAMVYAYEPEFSNFETLRYNVRRNRLQDKIHCFNMGVGAPGRHELYIHASNSGAMTFDEHHAKVSGLYRNVQVVVICSLQDIFRENNITYCDVLKMDCEGSEEDIIKSLDDDIAAKIGQISLEFHDKHKLQELVKILSKWYNCERSRRYEWICLKKV